MKVSKLTLSRVDDFLDIQYYRASFLRSAIAVELLCFIQAFFIARIEI